MSEDDLWLAWLKRLYERRSVAQGPVLERPLIWLPSCACGGHEERMRGHCERVAREERERGLSSYDKGDAA